MNSMHSFYRTGLHKSVLALCIVCSLICALFTFSSASSATGSDSSTATDTSRIKYPETRGTVHLTLATMNARIKLDNDDYKVTQKKVDIYQRRLGNAMHDKYLAENKDPPALVHSAQRVAYEKQRYTDWRTAELEYERNLNDLSEKYDKIKSSLKKQYTDILDLEQSLATYENEMAKLNANIDQLTAQISVGVAKESDMDVYRAQKMKLEADIAARLRDIELAKYNLKADLNIDQDKEISMADFREQLIRFDDSRIERQISNAVNGCFDVYSNEKKLEILKDERAIMLQYDYQGAQLMNLQNSEISIKETEYAIINARKSEESSLWSDYYSLLNQEDMIDIESMNVKIAENDYNIVLAKLNQGMLTPLDEQNSMIALEDAKTAHQTAINDYMRMSGDFQLRLSNSTGRLN